MSQVHDRREPVRFLVFSASLDWVSRSDPQPFNTRHGLLLSAPPVMPRRRRRI